MKFFLEFFRHDLTIFTIHTISDNYCRFFCRNFLIYSRGAESNETFDELLCIYLNLIYRNPALYCERAEPLDCAGGTRLKSIDTNLSLILLLTINYFRKAFSLTREKLKVLRLIKLAEKFSFLTFIF